MIRTIANQDPHVVERTHQERPKILAALEARNAELAAKLMEEHIDGVRKAVIAQLEALDQFD
jgi:DNA-binding GntR family transcriptional regulator